MNITEVIREAWYTLSPGRRVVVVAIVALLAGLMVSGWVDSFRSWQQIRVFERQAIAGKRDAADALARAAKIAREKLALEQQLAKLEIIRDEKQKQANDAHIKTLDARADYDRALREQRGDNPSPEQLCAELAALGYPCE